MKRDRSLARLEVGEVAVAASPNADLLHVLAHIGVQRREVISEPVKPTELRDAELDEVEKRCEL